MRRLEPDDVTIRAYQKMQARIAGQVREERMRENIRELVPAMPVHNLLGIGHNFNLAAIVGSLRLISENCPVAAEKRV